MTPPGSLSPHSVRPSLEIVVPVHDLQLMLQRNIRRLHGYTRTALPDLDVRITIADSASTDLTGALAMQLADQLPGVRLVQLAREGRRDRALRTVWSASDADIVAYVDMDLPTDLMAFGPLLAPLLHGDAHIAIGPRLGSHVRRGLKAARRTAIVPLLNGIPNRAWFFDTALLYLAQREGLTIFELPVGFRPPAERAPVPRSRRIPDRRGAGAGTAPC